MKELNIESDETEGNQFIKNATIGECVRHIQRLMVEDWALRPLEREVLLRILIKKEQEIQQLRITKKVAKDSFGGIGNLLGGFKK